MNISVLLLVLIHGCIKICGQQLPVPTESTVQEAISLHNGLTERVGNFSIELLYHTSKFHHKGLNLIMSPFTVWTALAVISEGATGLTARQINHALRISAKHRNATRNSFQTIYKWLQVNTSTVEITKVNAIYMDKSRLLEKDFQSTAENIYNIKVVPLDFTNTEETANVINAAISNATHGRISNLVESSQFGDTPMILTSALFFRGQWKSPFNASETTKMPFFSSTGDKIGDVNMMYNRYTYGFSNIIKLQARVIEIEYGNENHLSMLIMLPDPEVSLENMFFNFAKMPLDDVFKELRISKEAYEDSEVDCFIPRFKIESNLDLTNMLQNSMGIVDMFDQNAARLPYMARTPMYVSKVIHKAEIEVTEEGTIASGVTAPVFGDRSGIVSFKANRPFCYLIIEKVTNSIVFGGFYEYPSLY